MRCLVRCLLVVSLFQFAALAPAQEARTGSLMIIGGGLLPNNVAVFQRLIESAGGRERARFAIFPTASATNVAAKRFAERLVDRGLRSEQMQIIDLTIANAAEQSESAAVAEQIRGCTAIYFAGGDQRRVTRALLRADGSQTKALQAIHEVWKNGGVIAGSSAGAAIQSAVMISVCGLPDESLDEGMDALNFGLTRSPSQLARRGLLVTNGLGFFRGGIIDQHFSQYRGRLGRLARAVIEERVRFGFGIDEDTALAVGPDGTIEVLGTGSVTLVDSADAKCDDGPLGCRMTGIVVSCLQHGDRFNPQTGTAIVHPSKKPIVAGMEENNGNYLIPDISGPETVLHALIEGLANNSSRKQIGIVLKHNQHFGSGYRFSFLKTDETRSYEGDVNGLWSHAVLGVRLNIEPVTLTLRPPQSALPKDLPDGRTRTALEAVWFRGILLADDQGRLRPFEPMTRGELAGAIAQTIRLEPARGRSPAITDVAASPVADEIALVVANGLMEADARGAFRPEDPIARQETSAVFVRLAQKYRSEELASAPLELPDEAAISDLHRNSVFAAIRANLLTTNAQGSRPRENLTREEAALAIFEVIGFPWSVARNR